MHKLILWIFENVNNIAQTLTLICDGLMTFLLAIIALSLVAIVLTWLVGICVKAWCEVSRNFSRSIKKILLYLLCLNCTGVYGVMRVMNALI